MLINLFSHIMRSLWGPLHCYMQIVQRMLAELTCTLSVPLCLSLVTIDLMTRYLDLDAEFDAHC